MKQISPKTPKAIIIIPNSFLFFSVVVIILVFALMIRIFLPSEIEKIENLKTQQVRMVSNPQKITDTSRNEASKTAEPKKVVISPQTWGNQLRVPILMYHYIGNNPNPADRRRDNLSVSPDKFEEQMKYIKEHGYITSSLDTLYAALKKQVTLPNKTIILTFDDGYIDFYVNAYPILVRYSLHATVFIPTSLMEQGYYLNWSQIKEMQNSGLITFGAHTLHHYHLTSLSKEAALFELTESKKVLQDKLGVPINFMAYPYGSTNDLVTELTKEAGFFGSVGTWPGEIQSEGSIYNMPRLRVSGLSDITTFAKLL